MERLMVLIVFLSLTCLNGCSQKSAKQPANKLKDQKEIKVGAPCEGCDAIYESPVSFEQLNEVDTLPDFESPGPKLEISGIIYQIDGKTPAADVVLYVYHTDQQGNYATKGNEKNWGRRHGYIRGWIKTNANGQYKFYTLVPASYPNSNNPKHIHPTIKEPGKTEYWIDEFVFEDDPLLPQAERTRPRPVGGSGVLKTTMKDGMLRATRNIILGLNVDNYPKAAIKNIQSGLAIGSNCPAFDPLHLSGADKGKSACPMCKYGYGQGVMIWFNHANLEQMSQFVNTLETEMMARGEKKLRVFLIYMNPFYKKPNSVAERKIIQKKISEWCEGQDLKKVAVIWIPSPVDAETAGLYKINPLAKNTVFVYKKRKIAAKWVDMEYNKDSATEILEKI